MLWFAPHFLLFGAAVGNSPSFLTKLPFHDFYASQTKILENETAGRACLFEVLCEGVSTRFGLRMLSKSLEKTHPTRGFVFQNLRLGSIIFPNISTTISGSQFWEIVKKAGLVKNRGELPTAGLEASHRSSTNPPPLDRRASQGCEHATYGDWSNARIWHAIGVLRKSSESPSTNQHRP